MKHSALKKLAVIATALITAGASMTAVDAHATPISEAPTYGNENAPLTEAEKQEVTEELADSLETLFTEVVYEDPEGNWSVDYASAEAYGISPDEADVLLELMSSPERLDNSGTHIRSKRDLQSYGECVAWAISPSPISRLDAIAIGEHLANKRWREAAEKIVAVASLNGATGLLKYGVAAIGGPVGLAAQLAVIAGSCAISEKMP
ncbi:hypothetical protein C1Y63_12255 [Corynebacterium sp. 13CS0277]|uniref:hypothetical protein n=1 Tax=Corynebacterium sp. 13CS0277 TaxID=2071994 RepID=UPI000D036E3D|nr:hypothetical protein [Corynebacterium sp. 13CS0277]PRQ10295.1 hypothetical protein C1Y63_12255 [Corynebacterium sp. 13CS0277]